MKKKNKGIEDPPAFCVQNEEVNSRRWAWEEMKW